MRFITYSLRRLLYLMPQLLGISIVTFVLIRLLPGNPANIMAGGFATAETIKSIEQKLGLDQPMYVQYFMYISRIFKGDFGDSWYTGQTVWADLLDRVPATLELLTLALFIAFVIGVPLGVYAAFRKGGFADRIVRSYAMMAGSLPDFWVSLIFIFFFYYLFSWVPAPMGRIDISLLTPERVTSFLLIDSVIAGDWQVFKSYVQHLILPVLTLAFVNMGAIVKMTQSTIDDLIESGFIRHANALGLKPSITRRIALKNALPPIITIVAVLFNFLFSGAVLVETIFGWGGIGQYAVQSIVNSDYAPIQAFVLVATVFSLFIYLVVDLIYFMIDPRIKT